MDYSAIVFLTAEKMSEGNVELEEFASYLKTLPDEELKGLSRNLEKTLDGDFTHPDPLKDAFINEFLATIATATTTEELYQNIDDCLLNYLRSNPALSVSILRENIAAQRIKYTSYMAGIYSEQSIL